MSVIQKNALFYSGGGIYIIAGYLNINNETVFSGNRAQQGGAAYIIASTVDTQVQNMTFHNNSDGAISIICCRPVFLHGNLVFINNLAYLQSALYSVLSSISFAFGTVVFTNNTGNLGGAMLVLEESRVEFIGQIAFLGNSASSGGAIYCANGNFTFYHEVMFSDNTAVLDGGAIYASETSITLGPDVPIKLLHNSAKNGGGMYLRSSTTLRFMTT